MERLTLKQTMDRLLLLIRAGYPAIYVVSHEEARVLDYLAKIVRVIRTENPRKQLFRWYEGVGQQQLINLGPAHAGGEPYDWLGLEGLPELSSWATPAPRSGNAILDNIRIVTPLTDPKLAESLTVFFDLHPQLVTSKSSGMTGPLVRPLRNAADELRRYYDSYRGALQGARFYKTIVVVAPSAEGLSLELERDIIVIDFPLPELDELRQALYQMVARQVLRFPEDLTALGEEATAVCGGEVSAAAYQASLCELIAGAGRGLTLEDYRRGLNMFAVRDAALDARHIEDMLNLKAKAINNQALQYTPHVTVSLGGLEPVKQWVRLRRQPSVSEELRRRYRLRAPRGVMLCGVSGGGKSQLAKLIAKEFNLALLRLDVGALFGMYVGESEERTRKALLLAEVLAPVVLWIDEIDKAFTGMGSGGDNGVSARIFGQFLTWLSEKQESVFVVATANDYRSLLNQFPEFGRKGRFDEIFWVGLPDDAGRQEIFEIYLRPHYAGGHGYLQLNQQQLEELHSLLQIAQPLPGKGTLEDFCWLLSLGDYSGRLTGAEIEHAINESLYRAYELDQEARAASTFTAQLVFDAVKDTTAHALYASDSPDETVREALESEAQRKNWIFTSPRVLGLSSKDGERGR